MNPEAIVQKYVFYLHGAIVESQGADAVSPPFGAYRYNDIVEAFRKEGFIVKSEVRKPDTQVKSYAQVIVSQIN